MVKWKWKFEESFIKNKPCSVALDWVSVFHMRFPLPRQTLQENSLVVTRVNDFEDRATADKFYSTIKN